MLLLFAECPRTKTIIDTGILADERSLNASKNEMVGVYCDGCAGYHKTRVGEMKFDIAAAA